MITFRTNADRASQKSAKTQGKRSRFMALHEEQGEPVEQAAQTEREAEHGLVEVAFVVVHA
jgi:hypothetical protein